MDNAWDILQKKLGEIDGHVNPQNGDEADDILEKTLNPNHIMDEAYHLTHYPGSATCLIALLVKNKLKVANLGDSGFMAFEYKEAKDTYKVFLKEKSHPQQHCFNYPYQLVRLPDENVHKELVANGLENVSNELLRLVESDAIVWSTGANAESYTVTLNHQKIIVFGTDGLFDNLFVYEITNIIQEFIKKNSGGQKGKFKPSTHLARRLSEKLCKRAHFKTKDPTSKTPFQKEYLRAKGRKYIGGKVDDITSVVVM